MSERFVIGTSNTLDKGCGVGYVYGFQMSDYKAGSITRYNEGGAGWMVAHFVYKDEVCDAAFKQLKEKYKLVFKTTIRKNKNSGKRVYFAVFDTRGSGVPTGFEAVDSMYHTHSSYY